MRIYMFTIIIIFILATFSRMLDSNYYIEKSRVRGNIFVVYILIILSSISGFRYAVGTDYFSYREIFINSNQIGLFDERDFGYTLLNKIINLFTNNPQWLFLITSLIINSLIIYTIRNNSKMIEISIYIYIAGYMYFSTFNGIRQWISAAILFSGVNFLLNRKFLKYLIIILLASTMHQTALIMIPVYFIVNGKFRSIRGMGICIFGISGFIFYIKLVELLMKILEGTKIYNDYNKTLILYGAGSNFLRFLVALVPVILSLIYYKSINKDNDIRLDILMNLSLINAMVMLIGSRHWIFARFLMYFELYNLILYPIIFTKINKKDSRLIYYLLIVFYLVYCILLLKSGDSNIIPYRYNFNIWG